MSLNNDQEFNNSKGSPNSNGRYHGELSIATNSTNKKSAAGTEIDIRQILSLLLHNKWIVIIVSSLTTIFAIILALNLPKIYESEGTIIISTASNRYTMGGSDISSLLMSSYGIGAGSNLENELEILNSRALARSLAEKIYEEKYDSKGDVYPILVRKYPDDMSIVSIDTVANNIRGQIFVSQKTGKFSSILSVKGRSVSPLEAMRLVDLIINTYSETSTSANREQAKAALGFLSRELDNVKQVVTTKEEQLRNFMKDSKIVQLDAQTNELIRTLSRLQSEKQAFEVKIKAINESYNKYTNELEVLKPGISKMMTNSVAPLIQRLQIQLAEFQTERILLIAKNPELESIENIENSHPRLIQLNNQMRVVKEQLDSASKEILESNSSQFLGFIGDADGGIANKVQAIYDNIFRLEIERTQNLAQTDILAKQLLEYEQFFDNLPDNMIELARLKRDLLINEQLYLTLAKQSAEMSLWEQTQSGLARIVDTGFYPKAPVEPKKRVIVVMGFAIGFLLSVGFIFVKEITKQELDSVEKLRKKGYPILSVIPDLSPYVKQHFNDALTVDVAGHKVSTGLVTLLDSISPSAESYRRLQSNVVYSKPDNPYKLILVTSSNKSEGKTTLVSNLAVTMAETGKQVLIIDCDFRRPRIHNVFGVSSSPGVVDLLFSEEDPSNFIRKTVIENVSILTAGNRPPNPAEINRSAKFRNLIEKLKYDYDYVLLDTPPYGIITDAAPLIELADGVILVAKFNQTKTGEIDHTIDSLQRINAKVIGTSMTAFDAKKTSGYYYTDYYYQYSYESYQDYDKRNDV